MLKSGSEGKPLEFKRVSTFLRKIMLQENNAYTIMAEISKMLTTDKDKFETEYSLPYNQKQKPEWFKHMLVDSVLAVMLDQRIALSILFYGWWSPST